MKRKTERIISVIMFVILLGIIILIAMYAHGWLRYSFGDVLVIPALYFLVRIFTGKFHKTMPVLLFLFACLVELLQHFDICGILGIPEGSVLRIIIGTTGLWSDVWCYAGGAVMTYAVIFILDKIFSGKNAPVDFSEQQI